MTVNNISRFIGSLSLSSASDSANKQPSAAQQKTPDQQAVTLAPGLKGGEDRAQKVARIAEQVKSGTYKVDSKEVAESLYQELFA